MADNNQLRRNKDNNDYGSYTRKFKSPQLRGEDLMKLPGNSDVSKALFNHNKTLGSVRNTEASNRYHALANKAATAENDLRSIKSEYDYNNKKSFVDVLGQTTKSRLNGGSGLHNFYLGQQLMDHDNGNYRKDKHSGFDHTTFSPEMTQDYLSQITKHKSSKPVKGQRFKSVQKALGERLDVGEDGAHQESERNLND